jgi:hypothetical protein
MTTGKIDPRYGDASATPPPWAAIERLLTEAQLYWIITVRPDGRPHAVPLVGVWHEGAFAFCTGPQEQKQRNLDVVEGTAVRVRDPEVLRRLAAEWSAKYGDDWRFEVRGEEFVELSDSGGATEGGAWVYRVAPAKVLAFGDTHGQTAYRF